MFFNCKDYGKICFCRVTVLIGGRELVLRTTDQQNGAKIKEGKFKVTRMRCWRIMSPEASTASLLKSNEESSDDSFHSFPTCPSVEPALELSFEYLMPNNRDMQWICITSPQAILMSLCLQSIVEELLWMKANDHLGAKADLKRLMGESSPKGKCVNLQYNHKRQDGLEMLVPVRVPAPEASSTQSKMQVEDNTTENKVSQYNSLGILL